MPIPIEDVARIESSSEIRARIATYVKSDPSKAFTADEIAHAIYGLSALNGFFAGNGIVDLVRGYLSNLVGERTLTRGLGPANSVYYHANNPIQATSAPPEPVPAPLSLEEARRTNRCRICARDQRGKSPWGVSNGFIFSFGSEFAHEACLRQFPTRRWLRDQRYRRLLKLQAALESRYAQALLKGNAMNGMDRVVTLAMRRQRLEQIITKVEARRNRVEKG